MPKNYHNRFMYVRVIARQSSDVLDTVYCNYSRQHVNSARPSLCSPIRQYSEAIYTTRTECCSSDRSSSTKTDARPASPRTITSYQGPLSVLYVARDYIYPSLSLPPPCMSFGDQFAFQPTASTTAALIYLFHTIITLLDTNPFIIVCALDFSKALI